MDSNLANNSSKTRTDFIIPKKCPACNESLEYQGEFLVCLNSDTCPAQVEGRLSNWIKGLDIKEFGDKLIKQLVEKDLCSSPYDLYQIEPEVLASLDRMGSKSASTCLDNLWDKNKITLDVFLGSLSIPFIGASMIKLVMESGLNDLDKIMAASEQDFADIKGFGPRKAKALSDGLDRNKDLIWKLYDCIEIEEKKEMKKVSKKLENMYICITGATNLPRKELAILLVQHGAKWDKSVSKTTTHLCVADTSIEPSIKTKKAMAQGIKILSEEELLNIIK